MMAPFRVLRAILVDPEADSPAHTGVGALGPSSYCTSRLRTGKITSPSQVPFSGSRTFKRGPVLRVYTYLRRVHTGSLMETRVHFYEFVLQRVSKF